MISNTSASTQCTVLFADLVDSTQLYERVGDSSAFRLVDRCIKGMSRVVAERGGRVVKHTGDGLMVVFATPDLASESALKLHQMVRELPQSGAQRLAVRIGFHFGSVIESGNDLFGETVNFAARLAELASPGRALTTAETRAQLSPQWQTSLNQLPPRVLRGASRPCDLYELKCEAIGDITILQTTDFEFEDDHELKLFLKGETLVLNSERPVVRLGRDAGADLKVGDSRASRRHAEIELRGDRFILVDRSSNGTFIRMVGEKEFLLSRGETVLRNQGHLALGGTCNGNPFAISFICM